MNRTLISITFAVLLISLQGCVYTKQFGVDADTSTSDTPKSKLDEAIEAKEYKRDLPKDHGIKESGFHLPNKDGKNDCAELTPYSVSAQGKCPSP
jgi:hypothetical protein